MAATADPTPPAGPAPLDGAVVARAAARLRAAGFLRADDEAAHLAARAGSDAALLGALVERRERGEPLAWLLGEITFAGLRLAIDPGVYVPRPFTEVLACRAAALLPVAGRAVDLCTGSGAIAAVLRHRRPAAAVVATDVDTAAVACARRNRVDALLGDLFDPVPAGWRGTVDLVVGVVPYVPSGALHLLQRDTLEFESATAYDGGADGTDLLRRAVSGAAEWLGPDGVVLLELGGNQHVELAPFLQANGFAGVDVRHDDDGDARWVEARRVGAGRPPG